MTDPCQVDFYVLQDESLSAEHYACRLALMAWEQGNRTMILTENRTQAEQLDSLMWDYPQSRFLPHSQMHQPESAPVIIGIMGQLPDEAGDVIINLSNDTVPQPQRFQRLLEFVPADEIQRKTAREKFLAYRNHGLKPVSHPIN